MPGERSVEIKDGKRITAVYDIINHLAIYSIRHAVPVRIQATAFSQRESAILTASGRLLYPNWHLIEQRHRPERSLIVRPGAFYAQVGLI